MTRLTFAAPLVLAGCVASSPRPTSPTRQPEVASVAERQIDLAAADRYTAPVLPPLERRCAPKVGKDTRAKGYGHGYEFDPLNIKPISAGPQSREEPRPNLPRGRMSVTEAIGSRADTFHDCYRWARVRAPEWHGSIGGRLELDELGRVDWVHTVPSGAPDLPALRACISDSLQGVRLLGVTARRTIAVFTLDFTRSGLGTPPATLPRPVAQPYDAPETCGALPAHSSLDLLEVGSFKVGDFDFEQSEAERTAAERKEHLDWERAGRHGPEPMPRKPPRIRGGDYVQVNYRESAASSRRSFEHNRGAYQRCYAEAFARHPGLGGTLALRIEFTIQGEVAKAEIRESELSTDDPELSTCMLRAANATWMETMGVEDSATVIFPLVLTPAETKEPALQGSPTVSAVEALASKALATGWVETALHTFGALVAQGGEHPHRCQWHLGALRAALEVEPWVGERVLRTADELLAYAAEHRDQTTTCLRDAAPALERSFLEPYERAHDTTIRLHPDYESYYLERARERYRTLLQKAPFLAGIVRARSDWDIESRTVEP